METYREEDLRTIQKEMDKYRGRKPQRKRSTEAEDVSLEKRQVDGGDGGGKTFYRVLSSSKKTTNKL